MLVVKDGIAATTENGFHVTIIENHKKFSIDFLGNHEDSFQEIRFTSKGEAKTDFALICQAIADGESILMLNNLGY